MITKFKFNPEKYLLDNGFKLREKFTDHHNITHCVYDYFNFIAIKVNFELSIFYYFKDQPKILNKENLKRIVLAAKALEELI